MGTEYSVRRHDNTIGVSGVLRADGFRLVLSSIHDCVSRRGYQDVVLDFSSCAAAFPVAMLPICACAIELRRKGIESTLILPNDETAARLFVNANWAGLIDETYPLDQFRGYLQVPTTRFANANEQKAVVDRVMAAMLKSAPEFERSDFAAVDWALSELTDNVVNHSSSSVGGLIQFTRRQASKRIDVVVCDAGLGIPATLRPAYPQISSEFEALGWAIREGVTRDPAIGQGNGLFGSAEIAKRSGGYFGLHSGHASLFSNEAEGLILRDQRIPLHGTVVDVCMSYAIPNVLAGALKFKDLVHSPTDYIFLRYQTESEHGMLRFEVANEAESVRSRAAGKPMRQQLANLLRMTEERILVDFGDVSVISSSFADEAIAKLVLEVGVDSFRKRMQLAGVTPMVRAIISRAISQRTRQSVDI